MAGLGDEQTSSSPMCRRYSAEDTRSLGKHGQFTMAGFSQPTRGGARRAGEAGFRLVERVEREKVQSVGKGNGGKSGWR